MSNGYSASDEPHVSGLKFVVGVILVLVAIAGIIFAGWSAEWWFREHNIERESHLLRNSYANQQTLREQVTQNIGTALTITAQIATDPGASTALSAQRQAVVNIVCTDASELHELNRSQSAFVAANCPTQ